VVSRAVLEEVPKPGGVSPFLSGSLDVSRADRTAVFSTALDVLAHGQVHALAANRMVERHVLNVMWLSVRGPALVTGALYWLSDR
jgi:hypothetical protein